jgi:hypothetical protein
VNPIRLPDEIRVKSASDNPGMNRADSMKVNKMFAIECEHCSPEADRERQYLIIGDCLVGFSRFQYGKDIVSKPTQLLDRRFGEVLVGIQQRHGLGFLVGQDLLVDLRTVRTNVRPGVDDILRSKRGVHSQEIRFRCTKTTRLFEYPDGNPSSHNAWLAAADAGATFDAWKRIAKIVDNRLKQLRLFGSGHHGQQAFGFLKGGHGQLFRADRFLRAKFDDTTLSSCSE